MHEIQKQWKALWDAYEKTPGVSKQRYVETESAEDELFQKQISREGVRRLAATCEAVPRNPKEWSEFEHRMLAFLVRELAKMGDRDSLVDLLSKRCPVLVSGPETIEGYLAVRGTELQEPIKILGDAYFKSQVPETRHALATAIRRGFAGLGIHSQDDSEFVRNAMLWYENKKDHLTANWAYSLNETAPGGIRMFHSYGADPEIFDNPPPGRPPLFKSNDEK